MPFFCLSWAFLMFLVADSWICPHIRVADERIAPNVSSSKSSVSVTSLSVKRNLTVISTTICCRLKNMASILSINVDLRDAQKEHLQWCAVTPPDVLQHFYQNSPYRSVLPLHKTIWLRMLCWGYMRCSTPVRSWKQVYTPLKKLSPLIIYLDFEATMTTHKLIKKRSYRQNCLISGWFGLRPFSEIIDANNEMAVAIHLSEKANISI